MSDSEENKGNSEEQNDVEELEKSNHTNDVIERTEIILEQSNEIFNRLQNNIFSLKNRVTALFSILIAASAFELSLLQIVLSSLDGSYSLTLIFLIALFLILIIYSAILLFSLLWSTEYYDVNMFKEGRLEELVRFNKQTLLSDFIARIEENYNDNYKRHTNEIIKFKRSIKLFIIGNIFFIIIIVILYCDKINLIKLG